MNIFANIETIDFWWIPLIPILAVVIAKLLLDWISPDNMNL